jgi:hypothetical protein
MGAFECEKLNASTSIFVDKKPNAYILSLAILHTIIGVILNGRSNANSKSSSESKSPLSNSWPPSNPDKYLPPEGGSFPI